MDDPKHAQEEHEPQPQPPREAPKPAEAPEQTTGGTGTLPSEGVPNPGFTVRGD
jgi:hypothetical protein